MELIDFTFAELNRRVGRAGFSRGQRVFGRELQFPSSLLVDVVIDPYTIAQDASHLGSRVLKMFCMFCPFLRWSQMVLTRAKWPNVVLMMAVGAHCARTGTVGGAEQRSGQLCGFPGAAVEKERLVRKDVRPE